ncbi:MAG: sugar ABC transporter substrate-binding protein [Lachnospiraceae bacterium]|jgi:multiple sugar transport system substrate-binding protein|nr:sugar ABC transporter substrate-binding protein [Lachnospiraceae bacterium]MCH4070963.1 sugar ABC transporter substrate-binding protein [Lachnospiraceae bacterium]MCH4107954.1 sugar ABC transporter substrate-binding protein [Lachnospiraceae bacterium]MCI1302417.1 sugar ABC transporter substrate-binding protein [Lachnospiraceae bacterium]MCI1332469.1 sugar ABC transporter substrate-binding protein [Lachnospiraceae bacterium]
MRTKRVTAAVLTALMAASMVGCGSSSGTTTTGAAGGSTTKAAAGAATTTAAAGATTKAAAGGSSKDAGSGTIRVALWDYSNTEYYKTIFAAFEKKYPDIKIEPVEFSADEYITSIKTQLAGNEDYDVVFIKDLPTMSTLISQGHLKPLDEYMNGDSDFNKNAYSGLIDSLSVDGKTYGVPFRKDNNLLYYNKDLFDAAGVEYPKDGMTLKEYEDLAAKMTKGEGNDKVYGAHIHTWPSNVYMYARRDGTFDETKPDTYDSLLSAYNTILDMQNKGYVMDYGSLKASNIHYSGVFYNQSVAMMQMGTWFINMLVENADFNWGVCSLPSDAGTDNKAAVGGVTPVTMGAYGKNPEAAWTFIKYVCGEEGAEVLAGTGILPGYSSDKINEIFDNLHNTNEYAPEGLSKYINIDKYIIEFPMDKNGGDIDQIFQEEHSAIMTGTETAEQGIANLKSRVSALQ